MSRDWGLGGKKVGQGYWVFFPLSKLAFLKLRLCIHEIEDDLRMIAGGGLPTYCRAALLSFSRCLGSGGAPYRVQLYPAGFKVNGPRVAKPGMWASG